MPPKTPRKKMTGAGLLAQVKNSLLAAHKYVKEQKIVSKTLRAIGHRKLATGAALLGYGKRRKRVVRRRPARIIV